jgi:hypothetical protein
MDDAEREALKREWRELDDKIQAAYWRFCRCAKAPPPIVAVGRQVYARRAEIERALHGREL